MGYRSSCEQQNRCARILPAAALLFALLLQNALALNWGSAGTICFGSQIGVITEFDSPIVIVVMLMVFLIALAYMLGKISENEHFSFWAKIEAQNLIISGLLVMGVLGAFAGGCTILSDYANPGGNTAFTPYEAIDARLGRLSTDYGLDIAKTLLSKSMDNQMKAVAYIYYIESPFYQKGIAYKANLRAMSQHLDMVADMQIPFLMIIQAQRVAFMAAQVVVVSILLPAAILFRSFFITRDVGNFMIALALGLYFVVPMFYMLALGAYSAIDFSALSDLPRDNILDAGLLKIGYLAPAAILLPNLAMIIFISFAMAAHKALRGIGV